MIPALVAAAALLWAQTSVGAVSRAIVLGGNCEGAWNRTGEHNLFADTMSKLSKNLNKRGWQVESLFDDAPEAYAKRNQLPSSEVKTSTRQDLLDSLDKAISDKLGANDQLLLSINTHGFPGSFCMSDGNMAADDPRLLMRLQKLKDAGVRLAFTDSSCHGGRSVAQYSRFGCVVAGQTWNAPAHGGTVNASLAALLADDDDTLKKLDLPAFGPGGIVRAKPGPDGKITLEEVFVGQLVSDRFGLNHAEISGFDDGNDMAEFVASLQEGYGWKPRRPLADVSSCLASPKAAALADMQKSIQALLNDIETLEEQNLLNTYSQVYFHVGRPLQPPSKFVPELQDYLKERIVLQNQFDSGAKREKQLKEALYGAKHGLASGQAEAYRAELSEAQAHLGETEKKLQGMGFDMSEKFEMARAYQYLKRRRDPNLSEPDRQRLKSCADFTLIDLSAD